MTASRKPPPARIYRREAYPVDRPGSTAMTHDEAKWGLWSDGDDYVVNTGGTVRLFAGDITWREVPFNPADRKPTPAPRTPAGLADHARKLATDYASKNEATDISDGAYAGNLVDELVGHLNALADELARHLATTEAAGDDQATRELARGAARSAVEYVDYEGWYPRNRDLETPDACADAVLAALAAAGICQPETGCPKCGRLHFPWCSPYGGTGYAAAAAEGGER